MAQHVCGTTASLTGDMRNMTKRGALVCNRFPNLNTLRDAFLHTHRGGFLAHESLVYCTLRSFGLCSRNVAKNTDGCAYRRHARAQTRSYTDHYPSLTDQCIAKASEHKVAPVVCILGVVLVSLAVTYDHGPAILILCSFVSWQNGVCVCACVVLCAMCACCASYLAHADVTLPALPSPRLFKR